MHYQQLHIISLDNPFPPVYGGIIDIFYKVRALHKTGCKIHLHCFVNKIPASNPELDSITEKVYYYKINKSFFRFLSLTPFSVKSRDERELLNNLKEVNAPILFESLKTTAALPALNSVSVLKILRMQNIEHEYFFGIARSENNPIRKCLYFLEAIKFRRYESIISQFEHVLTLSLKETDYINTKFGHATYIPLFHGNVTVAPLSPFGEYAIYNGDLNVSDNRVALTFLIDIFKEIKDYPLLIAVSDNHDFVKKQIGNAMNISVVNPGNYENLQNLQADAHINVMLSYQATGTKLKVVNGLHNSRHCLINENMVDDPDIVELCVMASGKNQFLDAIQRLRLMPYGDVDRRRKVLGKIFDDNKNAIKIMKTINNGTL